MSGSFVVSMLAGVTVTTVLALTAVRLARRSRAAFRHVLLAASFAVLATLPIAPFAVPSIVAIPIAAPSEAMAPAIEFVADVMASAPASDGSRATVVSTARPFTMPSAATLLLIGWIVGAACFLAPVAIGLWQIRTIRRSALPWRRGEFVAARAGEELGVRQRVEVHMHEGVAGPMTCGIARPTVLFPIDAADWPAEEIDRAIVHELEHVRRHDWLSQCLARIVCAIYWFHPLVWIARRAFELEAERACDDAVLLRAEATGYADQLVGLATRLSGSHRRPLLAMASRRDLAARVRALLDGGQARGRAGTTAIATACVVAVALVLTMSSLRIVTRAQTADMKFDVASVRPHPNDAGGKRDFRASYGPQNIDFQGLSLGFIIGEAFAVPTGHVVGATDQVTGTLRGLQAYDIEARAPRPATRDELRGMLQSLLADRFKLTVHRENRELQVFRLVPASGGPKLTRAESGEFQSTASSDGFVFRNAEVSRLTGLLTSFVGREVVDETGLKGLYDFTVRMPDGYTPASAKMGVATGNAPDAASFAGPLRELGLQLVSGKATVEFLVVDHVERPTSNDAAEATPSAQVTAPKFEAVSIRPCVDDTPPPGANGGARSSQGGFPSISPGRFTIDCGTIERLISNAYVLNGERLENNIPRIGDVSWWKGGPEWIRYDKFTIEASAPGVTDRAILLGPMLRALLEDRFKLKLHRETQSAPMYAMTIAKSGLKIQPMAPGGCVDYRDQALDADTARANAAAVNAGTAKPNCDGMTMMGGPGHARWTIGGTTLPNFAGILTSSMDHHVIDKTGYDPETKFNIHLEFAPDEHVPGPDKRNPRTTFDPPDAPTIFAALEQQLGLKLEPTKGPQGVLVIDQVERPRPDGSPVVPMRATGPGSRRR
jgi:bla regulator protein blaR1